MRTGFNGFGNGETCIVSDEPMASLYIEDDRELRLPSNVVKL
jgi:ornithine decarboxylase